MARTFIIANQKGGVGKTSTALNLGAALARTGISTTLIDLDPQAALTVSIGLDPYQVEPSTYDLLLKPYTGLNGLIHTIEKGLFIVPANPRLTAGDYRLARLSEHTSRLKTALEKTENLTDVYIVDTPPGTGLLTLNALVAGTDLVIPVSTDYLALRGVRMIQESAWLVRKKHSFAAELHALVPTFYRPDSESSKAAVTEMRKVFGDKVSRTMIPYDEAVAEAPAARQSVLAFAPDSVAAAAYMNLAAEIYP